LYEVFKAGKLVNNFEDVVKSKLAHLRGVERDKANVLDVFQPLFEVTKDPSSHPELHVFLQRVVGFDSVDDESKPERRLYRKFPTARMWDTKQSPPYSYWYASVYSHVRHKLMSRIYYMYANMASLNGFRRSRGFST
jgi:AMP deaminase